MSRGIECAAAIIGEVKKAVIGKDECIIKAMAAILAGGHILIEDIPGVGKTTLALAFAKSMGMTQKRVQFTPDVLPADLTGFSMYDPQQKEFRYQPGAVLCNLFLADEINRTSPKTHSALLEVMEEGTVTVDGKTREVPKPFLVIATQNQIGSAGTQPLPESQLDRFMISMTMGYPDIADEIEMIKGAGARNRLDEIHAVIRREELLGMQEEVEEVFVHDRVYEYIARLVKATREEPLLKLGISPRGTIALVKMSKALAYLHGREYCIPADVKNVFPAVAVHRLVLSQRAKAEQMTVEAMLEQILEMVPQPKMERRKG